MDQFDDLENYETESTFLITGDDMYLIMKALDLYCCALVISNSHAELINVKQLAERILSNLPRPEFDA